MLSKNGRFIRVILAGVTILSMAKIAEAVTPQPGPSNFSYEGKVTDAYGNPSLATLFFIARTYDPNALCILREEMTPAINLANTGGYFSVSIGSSSNTLTNNDPGLSFKSIFSNATSITTSSCTYVPAAGDGRLLRVFIYDGTTTTALTPDVGIGTTPFAMTADTLQGLAPSAFIMANTATGKTLSQSNIENIFSTTNYPLLTALLAGTSTQYLTAASGGSVLPSYSGTPSGATAGQIWYDGTAQTLKYYNGSSAVALSGGGAGTVTSMTAGTGLTGGTITTSGTIALANSGVTPGTYSSVTVDTYGRATSGSSTVLTAQGSAGSPSYSFASDSTTGLWLPTTGNLAFSSLGSERVRISPMGVGIGTQTPNTALEVRGGAIVDDSVTSAVAYINFGAANVQMSSTAATTINLCGMNDGGAYTLVLTGLTAGSLVTVQGQPTYVASTSCSGSPIQIDLGAGSATFTAAGNTNILSFVYFASHGTYGTIYGSPAPNYNY